MGRLQKAPGVRTAVYGTPVRLLSVKQHINLGKVIAKAKKVNLIVGDDRLRSHNAGAGLGRPSHTTPVAITPVQIQEAVGAGPHPAHTLHGQPVRQRLVRLPQDARDRRACCQGRL